MLILRWSPFPESQVDYYKVYRSIIGFSAVKADPADVSGKTLILKMNGGPEQTITFSGTASVVEQINDVLVGGMAYASSDTTLFLVRSDIREAPGSVQIVGGTSLPELGLSPITITEKSDSQYLASVDALADPNCPVEYIDHDGTPSDYYAITTVNNAGTESAKTAWKKATQFTGPVCVIEGIVVDLQGVRIPDAKVTAKLVKFPHLPEGTVVGVTTEPVETLSGTDGRFSLAVLQGALVLLEVPAIGYSRNIYVPQKNYEFLTDLSVDLDYRYPLENS